MSNKKTPKKQQDDKNKKKRKVLIGIFVPIGTLAIAAAIATPLAISCTNKANTIKVEIDPSSGIEIKESKVEMGKDSTITLDVPTTKEIETLEVKVDNKALTKDQYTLDGNVIKIKGSAVTGNISIKVTTVDKISVSLTSDSIGVSIKKYTAHKNKEATITLEVPSTKEIDVLDVIVAGKTLTKETDYSLTGNDIVVKAHAVTDNISVKVIALDKVSVTLTSDSSQGVSILGTDVHQNRKSFIVLGISSEKEIDTLEIKVGDRVLAKGTDYKIEDNKITIEASAVNSNKMTIKVIVKDIIVNCQYSADDKKYISSDIDIKSNATITFNIKIGESTSVILPKTFSIVKDGSTDLVPISKVVGVTIKGEEYTGYQLTDNKIDLGDLTDKGLAKDDVVKIVLTTSNKSTIKAKAVCDPYVWAQYIDMVGNQAFKLSVSGKYWNGKVDYSTDGGNTWTENWDGTVGISSGQSGESHHIYLRGKGNTSFTDNSGNTTFSFSGDTGLEVSLNGNIMTLLDYDNPDDTTMGANCFTSLFENCTNIISIPKLPATTLSEGCYMNMFMGCSGLKELPNILPATTLTESCYSCMFFECSGLQSIPESLLPATTLADQCYFNMFVLCKGLKSLPENLLPAGKNGIGSLAPNCYEGMFYQCEELESLPAGLLPATELAESCYSCMFQECKKIESIPNLPATTLVKACYYGMFLKCEKIESTPALPATNLDAEKCYYQMFSGCKNLTKIGLFGNGEAIDISGDQACGEMFAACENLYIVEFKDTDQNLFLKTGIVEGNVDAMFQGCKGGVGEPRNNYSYKYVIEP